MRILLVPCDACDGGRIITQGHQVWDEIDNGTCPECHGACVIEVETYPVTLADHDDTWKICLRSAR